MINRFSSALFPSLLALALLGGCASKSPAPVEDRSQALQTKSVPTGPGYHTVKKGDTLYSIALEYGQDYREVAGWNYITDPNRIMIGQSLRVLPPDAQQDTPVASAPVQTGAVVEQRSLDGEAPVAAANTPSLKREPRGNKKPYSDAAYARLQNPGAVAVVAPATPAKPAENKPADAKSEADNKAASSTEAAVEGVTWSWPAAGKVVGNFSQTKGVDIAGKAGDPVLAAADGKVVYSGSGLRGYGQLVIIKHNATFLSAYAHNQKILVKEGQSVKRGQKIAEMGNTDSDSVKLHFEVRRQGKPVEPLEFLPRR